MYLHKLSIRKNFINKFFFDFCEIQRGDPLDEKKSKKILKFFEKNFINKNFSYAQFMKVHQKSQKNLNVYGQDSPITPEAGKKGLLFKVKNTKLCYFSAIFY